MIEYVYGWAELDWDRDWCQGSSYGVVRRVYFVLKSHLACLSSPLVAVHGFEGKCCAAAYGQAETTIYLFSDGV